MSAAQVELDIIQFIREMRDDLPHAPSLL